MGWNTQARTLRYIKALKLCLEDRRGGVKLKESFNDRLEIWACIDRCILEKNKYTNNVHLILRPKIIIFKGNQSVKLKL